MKSLFVFAALVLGSKFAAAAAPEEVIQAFRNDTLVAQAILKAKQQDVDLGKETESAFLGGGCGWAGCEHIYLVTLAVIGKGTNPSYSAIAAIVTMGPLPAQHSVKVVDPLLSLAHEAD